MQVRMWKKLDLAYIADRNVKWYSHSGNSLVVSLKTKHTQQAQKITCSK